MGLLERLGKVIRSNLNHLIQENQDPELILEQTISAMEHELIEMRRALAQAIASYKSTQRQIANNQTKAQKWYEYAQVALSQNNETLARQVLYNRQSALDQAQTLQAQSQTQYEQIASFKQNLKVLEQKFAQAKAKKNLYITRLRSAIASQKMLEISANMDQHQSGSIFEKIEEKILELEAEAELLKSAQSDPLTQKFIALEDRDEVEATLAKLKAQQNRLGDPSSS